MRNASREFLFNYRFDGKDWGISIFADDKNEACEKIKAVGLARYEGELACRIPAAIPLSGFFVRAFCWFKGLR